MNGYLCVLSAAALALSSGATTAQTYSGKTMRLLVGAPAGGQADLGARLLGAELGKRLDRAVVVEDRPGANGAISMQAVAAAPPDGSTFYFGAVMTNQPIFTKTAVVDASKVFAPVSNFYTGAYFFFYDPKLPASTIDGLVAYSRANPGKLNFGSPASLVPDLMMKLLASRTGMNVTIIPYKGSPQVIQAILTGEVAFSINSLAAYRSQVDAGKISALFVSTPGRSSFLPNVPTAAEIGIQNFQTSWANGLWTTAGTPREIIQKIYPEIVSIAKVPEVAEQIRRTTMAEPDGSTPEEQLEQFRQDLRFWTEAARVAKYEPQ